jgi:hypothetical protein
MNAHILENAAIYVNAYRANGRGNEADLRKHVARLFGAVYAAILIK